MKRNIKGGFIIQHGQEVLHDRPEVSFGFILVCQNFFPKGIVPSPPTWALLTVDIQQATEKVHKLVSSFFTVVCLETCQAISFTNGFLINSSLSYLAFAFAKLVQASSSANHSTHSTKGWWSCFPYKMEFLCGNLQPVASKHWCISQLVFERLFRLPGATNTLHTSTHTECCQATPTSPRWELWDWEARCCSLWGPVAPFASGPLLLRSAPLEEVELELTMAQK